jgi:hypothetical protein
MLENGLGLKPPPCIFQFSGPFWHVFPDFIVAGFFFPDFLENVPIIALENAIRLNKGKGTAGRAFLEN